MTSKKLTPKVVAKTSTPTDKKITSKGNVASGRGSIASGRGTVASGRGTVATGRKMTGE